MEAPPTHDVLADGIRALERADWETARAAFESVLAAGPSADARAGLGDTLWMLGHVAEGIEARAQAFEEYAREGRCDDAARMAVWVSHQHLIAGRRSAARGWLARCERQLDGKGDCVGRGWMAVEHARQADGVQEQIEHARRAMEIARASDTGDLEVFALSLLGRATVSSGDREAGMRLLEEAMAAATAGRVRDVHTLGEAYCNLVVACTWAGDWERATEWCEHVEEFARTHATAPLFAACRTVHADVLLATGRWSQAEDALEGALATHARYVPELAAPTVATLAELRVRQGRLAEAERLLAGREEHPSSLRALALLRIAEDRPRIAVALLERGLRATEGDAIREAQLLAPLVDALLACGEIGRAREAADALARLSELSGIRLVAARADLAAARIAVAGGGSPEAAEAARRALAASSALLMPLDAAEARLVLARALAADAPEIAADEARSAYAAFRELGASRAMDVSVGLLRELGGATGGRPRTAGELTAREQEVLELISLGMSNARIADTLVISEKTAGHHVSRILTKLGVRNRTEAAAYARAAGSAEAPAR
jgi:DNA-binding NarL/FixJ family response regulator